MEPSPAEQDGRPCLRERALDAMAPGGRLADALPGFTTRDSQLAMANAVADTLQHGGKLVCEAGTGTGKTLAYLVPALLSGRRVIISTGTRTLQDQLYDRDLPLAIDALAPGRRCAILKGRANYLCRQRLLVALGAGETRREEADRLARIGEWAERTRSGDIAEVDDVAEDASVWRRVTSTTENCLGQGCPQFDDCHVLEARRRAMAADVVVVNHHLLMADLALKEEGFGELLPGAEAVIVDEAHQLPDTATAFFGQSVSSGQLRELARDAASAHMAEAGDLPALPAAAQQLEQEIHRFAAALGGPVRRPWHALAMMPAVRDALAELRAVLAALCEQLALAAERGRELANANERAVRIATVLAAFSGDDAEDGFVSWAEAYERGFGLQRSPLDVGERFAGQALGRVPAWVFTSATLAVGGSVEHFATRLGLGEHRAEVWVSPFDYPHMSLCYLPPGLPAPSSPGFSAALVERIVPVLRASRGRAFLLFTSHAGLRRALNLLEGQLPYPLLVQGTAPRAELLRRFRDSSGAVLLGTASFWEGVDVPGSALSCVVIDKLPFAPPDDPLLEARARALKANGGDAFRELQLPQAVLALKQGVGRLIRSETDAGLLVLCDPRIRGRGYGRVFLDSLPPMPRTDDIDDVNRFLATVVDGAEGPVA